MKMFKRAKELKSMKNMMKGSEGTVAEYLDSIHAHLEIMVDQNERILKALSKNNK